MPLSPEEAKRVGLEALKRAKEGKPPLADSSHGLRVETESPKPYIVNGTPVYHLRRPLQLDGETHLRYEAHQKKHGRIYDLVARLRGKNKRET